MRKMFRERVKVRTSESVSETQCQKYGDLLGWLDLVVSFASSSLSGWTLALNTWDNTGKAEEESPKCSIDSNNRISAMVFDAPNLEEVGKKDGLEVYVKVWGDLASQLSIAMSRTFMMGYFLEYIRSIQERAVELLKNLLVGVATDSTWADEGPLHNKSSCSRLGGIGVGTLS